MKIITPAENYFRPLFLSVLFFLCASLAGQTHLQFAHAFGDVASDKATAVTTDAQGNIYMAGNFSGGVDFDPGSKLHKLYSLRNDQFLLKYDQSGKLLWAVNLGGNDHAEPAEIAVNSLGIYLVSEGDFFLTKLDLNGKVQWRKSLNGTDARKARDLALDQSGNIFIVGEFNGTADFDLGSAEFKLTSKSDVDFFVMKLDVYGDFQWVRTFGSNEAPNRALTVALDQDRHIILAGHFSGSLDADPGLPEVLLKSRGYTDFFILKLDASGNYVWSKQLGTESYDYEANDLAMDQEGNIFLTGDFHSVFDFDPGSGVFELDGRADDVFVLKLSAGGEFMWVRQMGGEGSDLGRSIKILHDNIVVAGTFQNTADFDPGTEFQNLRAAGRQDGFVLMLDSRGNFLSVNSLGGEGSDVRLSQVALGHDNALIAAGYFTTQMDLNPGPESLPVISAGSEDIFMVSLTGLPNSAQRIASPSVNRVNAYPNPSSGEFMIQAPAGQTFVALSVSNCMGAQVYSEKRVTGEVNIRIDLRGLPSGLYFVQGFTETEESFSTKIFID